MFGVNPYLAGGLALIFAALITFAGCEHSNASAARADRDAMESARDYARDAATSKDVVIGALTQSRDAWKKLATPSEAMDAAADRAELLEQQLRHTQADLDRLAREKDHAKPECAALLATDFERVCPAIARRLRERAEGRADDGRRQP